MDVSVLMDLLRRSVRYESPRVMITLMVFHPDNTVAVRITQPRTPAKCR